MKVAFDKAVARYLEVVGERANCPTGYSPSAVARNGLVFLRNRNGLLAVVTPAGKVFDRIGGERLDETAAKTNTAWVWLAGEWQPSDGAPAAMKAPKARKAGAA